jgi:hypothetical protein
MASWKDTIKDDDGSQEVAPAKSWKDTIVDDNQPKDGFFDQDVQHFVDKTRAIETPLIPRVNNVGELADTAEDFAVGTAQGATLGAADEIGGALSALLEKGASYIPGTSAYDTRQVDEQLKAQGFQVPEESLAESYRGYQQASQDAFKAAEERSPIANTIGNIAGSMASGTAVGGALGIGNQAKNAQSVYDIAKTQGLAKAGGELLKRGGTSFVQAAPAMALETAMVSEGNLDNAENREELGKDVLGGLAFGLPAVLGLNTATEVAAPAAKEASQYVSGKIDDFIDDTPFLRKMNKAFEYGEKGVNPISEKNLKSFEPGKQGLIRQETSKAEGLIDDIKKADQKLGEQVSQALDQADLTGMKMDIANEYNQVANAMKFSYDMLAEINENSRGKQIFEKLSRGILNDSSPSEIKALLNDVDSFIGKFDSDRNPTDMIKYKILPSLYKFRDAISSKLKTEVPAYGQAVDRFHNFRKLVPETILAGDLPQDAAKIWMGDLKNSERDLLEASRKLMRGATGEGTSYRPVQEAFENTIQGMKQFETQFGQVMPKSATDYKNLIQDTSDDVMLRSDMMTVKNPLVTSGNLVSHVAQLGRGGFHTGAYVAGKAKQPIANLSKKVYNMAPDQLNALAIKMQANPALKSLGQALQDGLANGDNAKKNAALFSIMQNPDARLLIRGNDDENEGN